MAEVIAEALTQTPAESLRETLLENNDNPHAFSQFLERFETHVERRTDLAHLITVGIASALNLDLATASRVANNAVKNNFLPMAGALALVMVENAALQYMRQVVVVGGIAALSYVLGKLPKGQRAALKNLWNEHAFEGSPTWGSGGLQESFPIHEGTHDPLITPLPEDRDTTFITWTPEIHNNNLITTQVESLPELEGFGVFDGKQITAFYKDLETLGGKVHGNNLNYTGPTHVYKITCNGEILKYGESTQGLDRFGQSRRAETQARRLGRETGIEYKTDIVAHFDNKRDAREFETRMINGARENNPKALPLNKNNR